MEKQEIKTVCEHLTAKMRLHRDVLQAVGKVEIAGQFAELADLITTLANLEVPADC